MTSNCIMCGAAITQGILCPACDRPRRVKLPPLEASAHSTTASTIVIPTVEPLSFPLDSVSPAVAAVTDVVTAAGAIAAILTSDRSLRFISEELKKLIGDIRTARQLEQTAGIQIGDPTMPSSSTVTIRERKMHVSVVPFADGCAVVFRQLLEDPPQISDIPKVAEVIRSVANRYVAFAELKSIHFDVSVPDFEERFRHHDRLADALGILVDNSLHYAPTGGQVVVGVRPMDHKGNPILLFFVMDNGPLVPEHMKHVIFESGFIWNPQASERTGRGLFKVREFAAEHGGSVWVDSRTQKACSFFLRLAPDP